MNILFVNDIPFNPALGGIERVTNVIARGLINKGYNVSYLSGKVKDVYMMQYDFPTFQHTLPEEGLFHSKINFMFLENFIEHNKIDIIINQRGLEENFSLLTKICPKVKLVNVVHSLPLAYFHCAMVLFLKSEKSIKSKIKTFIKILFYPILFYRTKYIHIKRACNHYNKMLHNSDALVLLTDKYKRELFSIGIRNLKKVYSIPNPNTFETLYVDLNKKKNIVLFVGRLCEEKAPMRLLKIWERIYAKFPQWELYFIGDGDEKENMMSYIMKKNLTNVRLLGKRTDVMTYYMQAKIVGLTSHYEGWGMCLTEGMQCGCVPITFNSYGAASDIIDDKVNGFLVSPFNEKEYASRMEELMGDEEKLIKMSELAIEKVKKFDKDAIIDKWDKLLTSLYNDKLSR